MLFRMWRSSAVSHQSYSDLYMHHVVLSHCLQSFISLTISLALELLQIPSISMRITFRNVYGGWIQPGGYSSATAASALPDRQMNLPLISLAYFFLKKTCIKTTQKTYSWTRIFKISSSELKLVNVVTEHKSNGGHFQRVLLIPNYGFFPWDT
jgi:hypothetical protein